MTYHDMDPNRPANGPDARRPVDQDIGTGWGIPLAIGAVVLIAGLLFFNFESSRMTTASNDAPVMRQTNPSTPTPAPPPAKTQ
jgi:hypothetical protein